MEKQKKMVRSGTSSAYGEPEKRRKKWEKEIDVRRERVIKSVVGICAKWKCCSGLISAEMLLSHELEKYNIVFDIRAHSSHDDPMTNGTYCARAFFAYLHITANKLRSDRLLNQTSNHHDDDDGVVIRAAFETLRCQVVNIYLAHSCRLGRF